MDDLELLESVLHYAGSDRERDVVLLEFMNDAELDYLEHLGELADPVTDDVEGECV